MTTYTDYSQWKPKTVPMAEWLKPSDETYKGFAAMKPGLEIVPWEYPAKKFEDYDIEIKITHCGICGSDMHTIAEEWGSIKFPQVVGHEIVGYVTKIGKDVDPKKYAIGTRVGVGPQARTCLTCYDCKNKKEHCCDKGIDTYTGIYEDGYVSQGGYADYFRCHYNWVVPIPDGIDSAVAAPMLCAGITTYQPLVKFGVTTGTRVAVLGIGGLGHLAVQWAVAMGADVTAMDYSDFKKEECLNVLKANKFVNASDDEALAGLKKAYDIILCTSFGPAENWKNIDWNKYLNLVASDGTFVLVCIPEQPLTGLKPFALHAWQISIAGTHIGPPSMYEEMFAFAAKHGVKTMYEAAPMSSAPESMLKVQNRGAHYRRVLVADEQPAV